MTDLPKDMTLQEMADHISMSQVWLSEQARYNTLPHYKIGKKYMFEPLKVIEWVRNHPNPETVRSIARAAIYHAKKEGKLKPGPCEVCGSVELVNGHHKDYEKPLDVVWLCIKHHMKLHNRTPSADGGQVQDRPAADKPGGIDWRKS